jgi:hypothetical protein
MNQFSCSFYLLLENKTLLESAGTIDSIVEFLEDSLLVSSENSEILCVCGKTEAPSAVANARGKVSDYLRIFGPSDWNLPGEADPYYGPEIVRYFGIASLRSKGQLVIVVEPETMIENPRALESAISAVVSNSRLLALSHNLKRTDLPTSAVLAHSALSGSTTAAASGYGVKVRKRLVGGVSYRLCPKEMAADVPWLIALIAAEFERDRYGLGKKVMVSHWM